LEIVQGDDFGKEQIDNAIKEFDENKGLRDAIFQIVNPRDWKKECSDPPGIKCSLFRYQKRALSWMLYRETNEDEYKDDGSLKSKSYLAPQCIPMKIQGKKAFFNHSQGCFTENPVKQALPAGGILADEMGLGMFLCNVALVDWWTNESIL
jgi:SNF2 family DNA or RNA helicase